MAATGCYGARRLADLLREQQEPLVDAPKSRSPIDACGRRLRELCALTKRRKLSVTDSAGGVTAAALGRSLLCACGGNNTARKALLWGDLTGCFFPCGVGQRFRRLPRAGDFGGRCDVASELGGDAMDGGRKLSPVSVLELQSDEESPVPSHWDEDDDGKPSTSARSPPSDHDQLPGARRPMFHLLRHQRQASRNGGGSGGQQQEVAEESGESSLEEMERATVSDWERMAADISRIPSLVALDVSESAREWWRRVAGDEEARRVGQSIEAMIFEEVRWEAVRDMICLREF